MMMQAKGLQNVVMYIDVILPNDNMLSACDNKHILPNIHTYNAHTQNDDSVWPCI